MRKRQGFFFALPMAFFAVFLLSCRKENRWDCFKGTGKPASEIRTVAPFNKIRLEGNIDVVIKEGAQEVKIEAGEHLIPNIETLVDSGIIKISNKNKCNWARSYKKGNITVYLTMPVLRYVWHYGSGFMQAADTMHCDTLDVWAHQTGNVDLMVNANVIYTNMHTTADLTLRGYTDILGCWHVGEGYMHCENLVADIAWAHNKSSGDDHLNVISEFAATIDWEGNIFYSGNPSVLIKKGNGKGQLIKEN